MTLVVGLLHGATFLSNLTLVSSCLLQDVSSWKRLRLACHNLVPLIQKRMALFSLLIFYLFSFSVEWAFGEEETHRYEPKIERFEVSLSGCDI